MRHVEFIPFRLTDIVDIFSIQIDGKDKTELQEFIITFKNSQNINFQKDFEQVVNSLVGIGEHGAKESFFSSRRKDER